MADKLLGHLRSTERYYADTNMNGVQQSFAVSTLIPIALAGVASNVGGFYDPVAYTFTPIAGFYSVDYAFVFSTDVLADDVFSVALRRDGTNVRLSTEVAVTAGLCALHGSFSFAELVGGADWQLAITITPASGTSDRVMPVGFGAVTNWAVWKQE